MELLAILSLLGFSFWELFLEMVLTFLCYHLKVAYFFSFFGYLLVLTLCGFKLAQLIKVLVTNNPIVPIKTIVLA